MKSAVKFFNLKFKIFHFRPKFIKVTKLTMHEKSRKGFYFFFRNFLSWSVRKFSKIQKKTMKSRIHGGDSDIPRLKFIFGC